MFWSGLIWNATGYTCPGSFGGNNRRTTVARKHFSGGDIYAESAVVVKSIFLLKVLGYLI